MENKQSINWNSPVREMPNYKPRKHKAKAKPKIVVAPIVIPSFSWVIS